MVWRNVPLYHLLKCLLPLCHALFVQKGKTKYSKRCYTCTLRQPMVDSCYCLDRSFRRGWARFRGDRRLRTSLKRRALITRLSSGTSAGTFAVSAGPYRNYQAEAGTKNEPDTFFVPLQKKGWKIDPHVSNQDLTGLNLWHETKFQGFPHRLAFRWCPFSIHSSNGLGCIVSLYVWRDTCDT